MPCRASLGTERLRRTKIHINAGSDSGRIINGELSTCRTTGDIGELWIQSQLKQKQQAIRIGLQGFHTGKGILKAKKL